MLDWVFAPDWLTVEQVCELSGRDRPTMLTLIEARALDTEHDGGERLIEKRSLWELLEALATVAHWC
jgi:excisionase family DNA binding protein